MDAPAGRRALVDGAARAMIEAFDEGLSDVEFGARGIADKALGRRDRRGGEAEAQLSPARLCVAAAANSVSLMELDASAPQLAYEIEDEGRGRPAIPSIKDERTEARLDAWPPAEALAREGAVDA